MMHPLIIKILETKKSEVAASRRELPLEDIKAKAADCPEPKDFVGSILTCKSRFKVIAEVKRISPGTGFFRNDFDPTEFARGYQRAGAAAISVLTDTIYFGGSLGCIELAKKGSDLPLLRKDFIIDEYQVYEAKVAGADAILLMAINFESASQAEEIAGTARDIGLDVLMEIHSEKEIEVIPKLDICIGINNRNFSDEKLRTDIGITRRLAPLLRESRLLVSESAIDNAETMEELEELGVNAFLIGTALMKEADPGKALADLLKT